MLRVKARVLNGRLTLLEPTELPEGSVVELVHADARELMEASLQSALRAPPDPPELDRLSRQDTLGKWESIYRSLHRIQEAQCSLLGRSGLIQHLLERRAELQEEAIQSPGKPDQQLSEEETEVRDMFRAQASEKLVAVDQQIAQCRGRIEDLSRILEILASTYREFQEKRDWVETCDSIQRVIAALQDLAVFRAREHLEITNLEWEQVTQLATKATDIARVLSRPPQERS